MCCFVSGRVSSSLSSVGSGCGAVYTIDLVAFLVVVFLVVLVKLSSILSSIGKA